MPIRLGYVALVLVALLAGCQRGPTDEQLQQRVIAYNAALVNSYISLDGEPLWEVATEAQVGKTTRVLHSLAFNNNIMYTVLEDIRFGEVRRLRDEVLVDTEERWIFWLQDRDTAKVTKPEEKASYKNTYHLIKGEGGLYIVDNIEARD